MEQFVELFLQLVDIGYQAGIAVLFVLAARVFLTMIGAPKKYSCMLGLLPFVRLALPIRLESIFSLLPKQSNPGTSIAMLVGEPVHYVSSENVIRSKIPVMPAVNLPEAAQAQFPAWMIVLAFFWLAGVIAFGLFGLFSVWRLKRKLRMSVRLKDNIYLADGIPSAFVLGVFRPKIYLPSDIDKQSKRYVIAHERAHIRRKDYIGKLAVYCLLCIYWMNPVLWIGFYFFRKDMELACDEMVIGRQDEGYRRSYAEALLKLSVSQKGFSKLPLAFAEESPKERIEKVIDYRKPKLVAAIIGGLLLIVLAVGLLTNPVKEEKEIQASETGNTEEIHGNTEETPGDAIQVNTPIVDLSAAVEWAGLYYADEARLIFGVNSGLFVYSKEEQKIIRGVDLSAIHKEGEEAIEGCGVSAVSEDGSKVYLFSFDNEEFYAYDVKENLITKLENGLQDISAYPGIDQDGNAMYETEEGSVKNQISDTNGTVGGIVYQKVPGEKEEVWNLFEQQQALDMLGVSDGRTHREGFQTPKLHYYTPKSPTYAYELKYAEEEEILKQRAQEALRELYDLTGYQVEECYYYCMASLSDFCFGMTEDDIERDRVFLNRRYDEIESMDIVSKRRVWYSPVDMIIYPEGYDTMTEKEKAVWFVTHSSMYNGQQPADAYQPYDFDSNIWRVVMADDTAYEVTLDSKADIVGSIYGPYPTSDIQH